MARLLGSVPTMRSGMLFQFFGIDLLAKDRIDRTSSVME